MPFSGYIEYHGLLLPHEAHTLESLEFAEKFSVHDTDVFAVTYPKSGTVYFLCYLFSYPSGTFPHIQADNFVLLFNQYIIISVLWDPSLPPLHSYLL